MSKQLYNFMLNHAEEIVTTWIEDIEAQSEAIYPDDPERREAFRGRLKGFIEETAKAVIGEEPSLTDWAQLTAMDGLENQGPRFYSVEFFRVGRVDLWHRLSTYFKEREDEISPLQVAEWAERIQSVFEKGLELVNQYYYQMNEAQLEAQQQMMVELSVPIIKLIGDIGVLPLVGDIDTHRAKMIEDVTLTEVAKLELDVLIIDMSGVPIIDTMVAQQLFNLHHGLSLIGTEIIITGIRPEIAETAVRLGIDFSKVKTFAHLQQALEQKMNIQIKE
ncbi:STAS domain-containing protein [Marinococcus sp. PL1-022]|uniref:STAS domain-containing protein n=1 Tax=Marinococcus sp. PL1-022 TaxID=3095363 RepID=UPI00260606F8|nr:STAS domain-containing protein [Marinococcus sp. PL1-022]MDX6152283.1 STAS domain-containing protein [Marinococcus sp. PL1-022]